MVENYRLLRFPHYFKSLNYRDGILRERHEHARGRNLADCGRICGSTRKPVGRIEEMWNKCSKLLTMRITTVKNSDFVEKR